MPDRTGEPWDRAPLLAVTILGADAHALGLDQAPELPAVTLAPGPVAGDWLEALRQDELAFALDTAGIAIDRRDLRLRPAWRSDEGAVALLLRRAMGPAPLTLLEFRGPLRAAARHGCGSAPHRRAIADAVRLLVRAHRLLARPTAPELWVAARPAQAVHTTIDPRPALRAALGPFRRGCRLQVTADHCDLLGATAAIDAAVAVLEQEPWRRIGGGDRRGRGRLRFRAAPGHAFGTRPLAARLAGPTRVLLQVPLRAPLPDHAAALAARLALRAAASVLDQPATPAPATPARRRPALLPDLLPLLHPPVHDAAASATPPR